MDNVVAQRETVLARWQDAVMWVGSEPAPMSHPILIHEIRRPDPYQILRD